MRAARSIAWLLTLIECRQSNCRATHECSASLDKQGGGADDNHRPLLRRRPVSLRRPRLRVVRKTPFSDHCRDACARDVCTLGSISRNRTDASSVDMHGIGKRPHVAHTYSSSLIGVTRIGSGISACAASPHAASSHKMRSVLPQLGGFLSKSIQVTIGHGADRTFKS